MSDSIVPGELMPDETGLTINEGRETTEVTVANTGDRPVQIGSHFHFFEVNAALAFDREAAYGMRLNVPAGTAVRFEPGDSKTVELVAIGGKRRVSGMNGLTEGTVDSGASEATKRASSAGFATTDESVSETDTGVEE